MGLRVIGAGLLGLAVAAQSVPAHAADCESPSGWRDSADQQSIQILAKGDNIAWKWLVRNREFVVDGEQREEDSQTINLDTKLSQIWKKNLRYYNSNSDPSRRTNEIIVLFTTSSYNKKVECTFKVETKKQSRKYHAKAFRVKCTGDAEQKKCSRQYTGGGFAFEITLGPFVGSAESESAEKKRAR